MSSKLKMLVSLISVVFILSAFPVVVSADRAVADSGSTTYYDWTLYEDGELFVNAKYENVELKNVGADNLKAAKKLTVDISGLLENKNNSLYLSDCESNIESIQITGGENCEFDTLSIRKFEKNDSLTLPKGMKLTQLELNCMPVNSLDFLADVDLAWLNYTGSENYISDGITGIIAPADLQYFTWSIDKNLKEVTIESPSTEFIFYYCWALTDVNMPDGVTKLKDFSFMGCYSLESITIPDSVVEIGESAFQDCTELEKLDLPSSLQTLGKKAFKNCRSVTDMLIPESLVSVYEDTFQWMNSLKDVYYSGSEEQWKQIKVLDIKTDEPTDKTLSDIFGNATIHFNYKTGWVQDSGIWYYYDNGTAVTGWQQIDGVWYYFGSTGAMTTGWLQVGGKWYYFASNGLMVTGWKQIGGVWYYFKTSGEMATGWQSIGGKWYYFASNGAMVTGWKQISGVWYYFETSGAMATGWKQIGGVYYFFKSNGAMAANEYCGGYRLDADGKWTYKYKATWRKDSKGWWYGDSNGWYAKNETWKIDGKNYNFDKSGYCTNP